MLHILQVTKEANVNCAVLNWSMSTIELTSNSLKDVAECRKKQLYLNINIDY